MYNSKTSKEVRFSLKSTLKEGLHNRSKDAKTIAFLFVLPLCDSLPLHAVNK